MSKAMTIDEMIATNPIAFNIYINKIRQETTKVATERVFNLAANVTAVTLHKEFGFGTYRLNKFFEIVNKQMECIVAGTVDLKEIVQEVKRLGVIIE